MWTRCGPVGLLLLLLSAGCGPAFLEPAAAGPDYLVQGEYAGAGSRVAAQVIALGGGEFELVLMSPGLPGAHGDGDGETRTVLRGERRGDAVHFEGAGWEARWADGRIRGRTGRRPLFDLPRVERTSPTLGAAPPPGAVVLFDGASNAFDGSLDENGWLEAGARSRAAFGDIELHLEFRIPFMPESRGQARGNSGVYLQGRYEVQVLDSFGLRPESNDCGAIYEVAKPSLNLALPPLAWQTYDIDFRAARFDDAGSKIAPAQITVRHNGITIHDAVAIPGPTGRGAAETPERRSLVLQDHWNPVVYRNIWLVERRG